MNFWKGWVNLEGGRKTTKLHHEFSTQATIEYCGVQKDRPLEKSQEQEGRMWIGWKGQQ